MAKSSSPKCECGGGLIYVADIAAPGHGQSWKCAKCDTEYWKTGKTFVKWSDIEGDPY